MKLQNGAQALLVLVARLPGATHAVRREMRPQLGWCLGKHLCVCSVRMQGHRCCNV